MKNLVKLMVLIVSCEMVYGRSVNSAPKRVKRQEFFDEKNADHWMRDAQWILKSKLETSLNTNRAKNIILFLGDGMSFATLAATRAYMGREMGMLGEEMKLSFEDFPYTGLSKTYCIDRQVADSACSATAYLCGAKANFGTIGLSGAAKRGFCSSQTDSSSQLTSISGWAQMAGKKTGIVTTTRVTHASPAGSYAHAAERGWESDTDVRLLRGGNCTDIATQLIRGSVGSKFNVILGGGRRMFIPKSFKDSEGVPGFRSDGIDLIAEWIKTKNQQGYKPAYVFNKKDLMNLNVTENDHVLGLFDPDHMQYHLDADPEQDPSLEDMTTKAIEMLSHNNSNGFFLFVEAGRIDQAHHDTKARKALDETAELSKAVEAAMKMVNIEDTLVVVTSDHSHTMTFNGYNRRGSDVLGVSQSNAADGLPYMILSYANGPGYRGNDPNNKRHNIMLDKIRHVNYTFPALIPMVKETHGGEDVAVYAVGPWSHLFTGNWEQTFLPHAMAYAACVGPGVSMCENYT